MVAVLVSIRIKRSPTPAPGSALSLSLSLFLFFSLLLSLSTFRAGPAQNPAASTITDGALQGYLAQKKQPPPRTLRSEYA